MMKYSADQKETITETLLARFGRERMLSLIFYPFYIICQIPFALLNALRSFSPLFGAKGTEYLRFSAQRGLNDLWYWTMADNLKKYGSKGVSPHIGNGNFPISRWFHLTRASLYLDRSFSCLLPFFCTVIWAVSFLSWLSTSTQPLWVLGIVLMVVFSSTFYMQAFRHQNYNMMGWMLFPLGIFAVVNELWLVAGVIWLLVSFFSFTATLSAGLFMLLFSMSSFQILPFLSTAPAGMKLVICFLSTLSLTQDSKKNVTDIANAIGIIKSDSGYKRPDHLGLRNLYFLGLYMIFPVSYILITGNVPLWTCCAFIIFVLNQFFVRFADIQSVIIIMATSMCVDMMVANQLLLFVPLWLALNYLPDPFFFTEEKNFKRFGTLPLLKPYHIGPVLDDMRKFFADVPEGGRVLFAYEDPQKEYANLFDGYRALNELPGFIATEKGFHAMPDFHLAFMLDDVPDYWGRTPEKVLENVRAWNATHIIVYQKTGSTLEPVWEEKGFNILSTYDFGENLDKYTPIKPWMGDDPKWWLLKAPD